MDIPGKELLDVIERHFGPTVARGFLFIVMLGIVSFFVPIIWTNILSPIYSFGSAMTASLTLDSPLTKSLIILLAALIFIVGNVLTGIMVAVIMTRTIERMSKNKNGA